MKLLLILALLLYEAGGGPEAEKLSGQGLLSIAQASPFGNCLMAIQCQSLVAAPPHYQGFHWDVLLVYSQLMASPSESFHHHLLMLMACLFH